MRNQPGHTVKNRLEYKLQLLQMEGMGFTKGEIVKTLADQYHVSEKLGYYYFKTRHRWQLEIVGLDAAKDSYYQTLNRLEFIYRRFSTVFTHATEDSNKIGALKGMLETTLRKAEVTGVLAPGAIEAPTVSDALDAEVFKQLTADEEAVVIHATHLFLDKRNRMISERALERVHK